MDGSSTSSISTCVGLPRRIRWPGERVREARSRDRARHPIAVGCGRGIRGLPRRRPCTCCARSAGLLQRSTFARDSRLLHDSEDVCPEPESARTTAFQSNQESEGRNTRRSSTDRTASATWEAAALLITVALLGWDPPLEASANGQRSRCGPQPSIPLQPSGGCRAVAGYGCQAGAYWLSLPGRSCVRPDPSAFTRRSRKGPPDSDTDSTRAEESGDQS
jgi:hypothetical protein